MFKPADSGSSRRNAPIEHAQHVFILGISVYLLAKLYLLMVTYLPAGMARLGDDGLIYLWKGMLAWMGDGLQYPGLKDVLDMENSLPPRHETRTAVSQLYTGTVRPLADLFYGLILKLGLSLKWSAFLSELSGLAVMTAGTAALLARLFGSAAAGIGLCLLAFAQFPNQGIYSYIPSTMALSLGMLWWAWLYRTTPRPQTGFLIALAIASVHPAGKLYALLGILFHYVGRHFEIPRRPELALYAAMIGGMLAASLWPVLWPPFVLPGQVLTGGLNLSPDYLVANGKEALKLLVDPVARKNWVLATLALMGLTLFRNEIVDRRVGLIVLFVGGLCVAALAHELPTYPAELFSRLLVPTLILLAGVAGAATIALHNRRTYGLRAVKWLLAGGFLLQAVLWCWSHSFGKLNERTEVIDEPVLAIQLESLPSGTTILYPELDITVNSSFLLGGYRLRSFVYPILAGTPQLSEQLDARRPAILLAREPAALNTLALARVKSLTSRRLGFLLEDTAAIRIESTAGRPITRLYLHIDNQHETFTIGVGAEGVQSRRITIPAYWRGWLQVWEGQPVERIDLGLPAANVWIDGISSDPEKGFSWPWLEEMTVLWKMREGSGRKQRNYSQQFTPQALLESNHAVELIPWLHPERPFHAEGGGFVWLNTRYATFP